MDSKTSCSGMHVMKTVIVISVPEGELECENESSAVSHIDEQSKKSNLEGDDFKTEERKLFVI
jgi:hypothetical protein